MAAAVTARQAATAAQVRAAAAALLELLVKVGDAIACGGVRLLLEELAAAPQAGPKRQVQPGAAPGQATRSRARRRREQRARAMRARLGASGTVHTSDGGGSGAQKGQKSRSLAFRMSAPDFSALGERRAAALRVFAPKSASANCAVRADAGVSQTGADSAGAQQQQEPGQQLQQTAGSAGYSR
eukprot:6510179-Prymnesium_polylepis.1